MNPRRAPRARWLAPLVALIGACTDAAPERAGWADVAPILAAHCVRCHGAPALGGAPTSFRLDRYDDVETPAGRVLGAASMAEWIALRAEDGSMPPRFGLASHDVDVLSSWYATRPAASAGAPALGPPRGAPRPGNRAPQFSFETTTRPGAVEVRYQLRDPDRDLVVGELRATRGPSVISLGELRYVAIMRRVGPAPLGLEDEAGWLFTQASAPGGSETYRSLCWNRCHVAAPYAGAFLDYGK